MSGQQPYDDKVELLKGHKTVDGSEAGLTISHYLCVQISAGEAEFRQLLQKSSHLYRIIDQVSHGRDCDVSV